MDGARPATHAGSWYTADGDELSGQLEGWLGEVDVADAVGTPVALIAPTQGGVPPTRFPPIPPTHSTYLNCHIMRLSHRQSKKGTDLAAFIETFGRGYLSASWGESDIRP
jgi:hypothetical protein